MNLKHDESLSNFYFEFNLRRYRMDDQDERKKGELLAAAAAGRRRTLDLAIEVQEMVREGGWQGLTLVHSSAQRKHVLLGTLGA